MSLLVTVVALILACWRTLLLMLIWHRSFIFCLRGRSSMEGPFLVIMHKIDRPTILFLESIFLLRTHANCLFHVPLFWLRVVVYNKCCKLFWQRSEHQVNKNLFFEIQVHWFELGVQGAHPHYMIPYSTCTAIVPLCYQLLYDLCGICL